MRGAEAKKGSKGKTNDTHPQRENNERIRFTLLFNYVWDDHHGQQPHCQMQQK
jgi:hypothetical protein